MKDRRDKRGGADKRGKPTEPERPGGPPAGPKQETGREARGAPEKPAETPTEIRTDRGAPDGGPEAGGEPREPRRETEEARGDERVAPSQGEREGPPESAPGSARESAPGSVRESSPEWAREWAPEPLVEPAQAETGSGQADVGEEDAGVRAEREAPAPERRGVPWGRLALLMVVMLAIGALGAGYWAWHELEALRLELARAERASEERVTALSREAEAARGALREELSASLEATLAERVEPLRADVAALGERVERLAQAAEPDPDELLASELEYLVRVADHRLRLERDRDGALEALEAARGRLAAAEGDAFAALAEALESDIASLRAAQGVDLEALGERLAGLAQRVDELAPLDPGIVPEPSLPESAARDSEGWRALLAAMSENLSQFVRVRRAERDERPSFIPDEQYLVRENIKLALENAVSAALRRDPENYRASLAAARAWLERYFAVEGETVTSMLEALAELETVNLTPELPDLSASLAAARRLAGELPGASGAGGD